MSQEVLRNSGGYQNLKVAGVPASVEEYDQMAKATGACLERAVDADFQHNWNGKWRAAFVEALEEETDIKRPFVEEDGKKKFVEHGRTENTFIKYVETEKGQKYPELAQKVADTIEYQVQGTGGGSIGQKWLGEADSIIAAVGDGSWDGFITNITNLNPGYQFTFEDDGSTPTRESVAIALKTEQARADAEAKAQRLAMVG